jgi:N-acylneuraminate cytidylyltransferase
MRIKNRICGDYGLYMTPEDESFDIDTALDFILCEAVINSKKGSRNFAV